MSLKLSENETLDFKDCGTWPEKNNKFSKNSYCKNENELY